MGTPATISVICQDKLGLSKAEQNKLLHETKEFRTRWETQHSLNLIASDTGGDVAQALLKEMAREWLEEGSILGSDSESVSPLQFFWGSERMNRAGKIISLEACKTKILEDVQQVFLKQHQNRKSNESQKRRSTAAEGDGSECQSDSNSELLNMNAVVARDKISPMRRQTRNTTASSTYSGLENQKQTSSIINSGGQANSRILSLAPSTSPEQTSGVNVFSPLNGSFGTLSGDNIEDCNRETCEKLTEGVSPHRTQRNGQYEPVSEDRIVLIDSGKAEGSNVFQKSHQLGDEIRRSNLIRKAPPTEHDNNEKRQKSCCVEDEERLSITEEMEKHQPVSRYRPEEGQVSSIQLHQPSPPPLSPSAGISTGTGQTLFHQHGLPGLSRHLPNPPYSPSALELTTTNQGNESQKTQATAHSVAPWAASLANTPITTSSGMTSVDTFQASKASSIPSGQNHHETSNPTRNSFSTAPSNEQNTSSVSSTTNRQSDKHPVIQPPPTALMRSSITMEGSASNRSFQTTLAKPIRILIWVQSSVEPPMRYSNWDSPRPFLKHSVAQLFATVMTHDVACNKNINCIMVMLELPPVEFMIPPYHYKFKVKINDIEDRFQLMKDFMTKVVKQRTMLIYLKQGGVEGGPTTGRKPGITVICLRPFVMEESENAAMADGKDDECMF